MRIQCRSPGTGEAEAGDAEASLSYTVGSCFNGDGDKVLKVGV